MIQGQLARFCPLYTIKGGQTLKGTLSHEANAVGGGYLIAQQSGASGRVPREMGSL